jgi:sorting nexin-4
LGDALLNAFSKIKKPDERFIEIKENIDKIEENLQTIERLYFKIIKRQSGIFIL